MDTLRNILQPFTQNLPPQISDLVVSFIGESCYKTLLLDVNLESPECLKLAISKGLGIGIISASSIVKVPQIIKLLKSHSASGISFLSYLLETSSYLISLAYSFRQGFPLSTFGETGFIMIQNVVIAALVLHYSGKASASAPFVAGFAICAVALLKPTIVDMETLSYLQAAAGTLGIASKLPQIIAIWEAGETGQLSAFAVFNFLLGSLARVFTTLQEVDDKLILYGHLAGLLLNAVIAIQMLYFWNSQPKVSAQSKETGKVSGSSPAPKAASSREKKYTSRRRG
ncbi:hypothetical protein K3495_g9968 [Podosphaera aphanis]|nr:hypothetical protein K3495_g9968 [Podosphaera aphanis]